MGEKQIPADVIKEIELSILDYIDDVCKTNHIKYYLAYGTLLGAIRHKGFIPWDDDIDIYLLRDDYMKFVKIVNEQRNDRYEILSIYNDDSYNYEFAKVIDKRTALNASNFIINKKEGVWVDVFPLDYTSKFIKLQKTFINLFVACRILSVYRSFPSDKRNICFYPLWIISKYVGPRFFLRLTDKLAMMGNNKTKVGYMASMGVSKFFFPSSWCNEVCVVDFEGRKLPAFKCYNEYLSYQYGDYMQLPPEDKRISHPVEAYWR